MTGSEVLPCPLGARDPRQSVQFLADNSHHRVPNANPKRDDSSSAPGISSGQSSLALSSPSWWRPVPTEKGCRRAQFHREGPLQGSGHQEPWVLQRALDWPEPQVALVPPCQLLLQHVVPQHLGLV